MYMKDLKHKMTLRLNDDLLNYVTSRAESVGLSPSDFIRQCIGMHKDAYERANELLERIADKEGFENGTDRKTDKHDLV